jgi:pSer/pThr/pTyr-binding forkhead associated (FHA) protein
MKAWLQKLGTATGTDEICLDHFPFVIGRKRDNHGCLPLAFISRRHCQFTRAGDQILVRDLESYNGTFVNGKPASQPVPVHDGDEITLGPMSFRVVLSSVQHETTENAAAPTNAEMVKAAW